MRKSQCTGLQVKLHCQRKRAYSCHRATYFVAEFKAAIVAISLDVDVSSLVLECFVIILTGSMDAITKYSVIYIVKFVSLHPGLLKEGYVH